MITHEELESLVENIITDSKGNVCHRIAELIRNLKQSFPNDINFMIKDIKAILAKRNINCDIEFSKYDPKGVSNYLEKYVPEAEPLNE